MQINQLYVFSCFVFFYNFLKRISRCKMQQENNNNNECKSNLQKAIFHHIKIEGSSISYVL